MDRVDAFTFHGHNFARLEPDSAAATMPEGLYDILYTGNSKVIAKRHKASKKEVAVLVFSEKDQYYVYKDGQYHAVNSKPSVLKVFRNHRKELSKFLRDNNISFKDDREVAIVHVATQNDMLSK